MTEIYYTRIPEEITPASFTQLLAEFPEPVQRRIIGQKRRKKVYSRLFGYLLLKRILDDKYFPADLTTLTYQANGKPFISRLLDFNISHSGEMVACVVSDELKVGIDVERMRTIDVASYSCCLNTSELEQIMARPNTVSAFYRLWTQKEAAVKADGIGLKMPMRTIQVDTQRASWGSGQWYLQELQIDKDYVVHLASNAPMKKCNVRCIALL